VVDKPVGGPPEAKPGDPPPQDRFRIPMTSGDGLLDVRRDHLRIHLPGIVRGRWRIDRDAVLEADWCSGTDATFRAVGDPPGRRTRCVTILGIGRCTAVTLWLYGEVPFGHDRSLEIGYRPLGVEMPIRPPRPGSPYDPERGSPEGEPMEGVSLPLDAPPIAVKRCFERWGVIFPESAQGAR
jgi:hypothetical protein